MDINPKLKKSIVSFHIISFGYLALVLAFCVLMILYPQYKAWFSFGALASWLFFFLVELTVKYLKAGKKFAWVLAVFFGFYFLFCPFIIPAVVSLVGLLAAETRKKFFSKDTAEKAAKYKTAVEPADRKRGLIITIVSVVGIVIIYAVYFVLILMSVPTVGSEPDFVIQLLMGIVSIFVSFCVLSAVVATASGLALIFRYQAVDGAVSGQSDSSELPQDLHGWNWGAFGLGWFWGVYHKTYYSYLTLIPFVGLIVRIILGVQGNELAWKNIKYANKEHFLKAQRDWKWWGLMRIALFFVAISIYGFLIASLAIDSKNIQQETAQFPSKEAALDDMFGALTSKRYIFEQVPMKKNLPADESFTWVEVRNKREQVVEQGFFLVKTVSGGVIPEAFWSRDLMLDNPERIAETKLISVDPEYYDKKITSANGGKKIGSFMIASEWRQSGINAINRNDLGTAESHLIKALEAVGEDNEYKARIYSNLGIVYNNSHRTIADINAMYQKAVDELDESYPGYFTYKGIIAVNLGDEKRAIEYLKKGVEMKPDNFDALTALGNIYLRSKDPGITDCNKAYEYFTRSNEVGVDGDGFKLAQAAVCIKKYPEAIKILNGLLASGSYAEKSMIYYWLALAYGLNGDFAQSEPYYIKAIDLTPGVHSAEMDKLLCEGLKKADCKY